jgi:hypothetical protein
VIVVVVVVVVVAMVDKSCDAREPTLTERRCKCRPSVNARPVPTATTATRARPTRASAVNAATAWRQKTRCAEPASARATSRSGAMARRRAVPPIECCRAASCVATPPMCAILPRRATV